MPFRKERYRLNTITIKNLSTFTDYAAVGRVAQLLAGDESRARCDEYSQEVVIITRRGNAFTVTDKEQRGLNDGA